jgi:hypothetical protein
VWLGIQLICFLVQSTFIDDSSLSVDILIEIGNTYFGREDWRKAVVRMKHTPHSQQQRQQLYSNQQSTNHISHSEGFLCAILFVNAMLYILLGILQQCTFEAEIEEHEQHKQQQQQQQQ